MSAPVPFVLTPDERRAAERESKLLAELAKAHYENGALASRLEYVQAACLAAQKECMRVGSVQWCLLQRAIDRAREK